MGSIIYSFNSVSPIFLIIAIGVILRRMGLIDSSLSEKITRLVFNIFLPALLLKSFILVDFQEILSFRVLLVVWGTLLACFFIARGFSCLVSAQSPSRGFFASGAIWGNVAIIGYALGEVLYGLEGLSRAAIFSALVMPLHIFIGYLSMGRSDSLRIALNTKLEHTRIQPSVHQTDSSKGIFTLSKIKCLSNELKLIASPVIAAIVFGILLGFLPLQIPTLVLNALDILGKAGLPLALIAIGGSLRFKVVNWVEASFAAIIKLIIMPVVAFLIARAMNLERVWIASIVIGFSCPTAISFFVISRSLGHEASRAAAIVTASTVGSVLSVGITTALLKIWGYA